MIKEFILKLIDKKDKKEDTSSEFSKFFRTASSREKKKVYLEVARKASEEQREVIRSVAAVR